jgi:hypothetical protein
MVKFAWSDWEKYVWRCSEHSLAGVPAQIWTRICGTQSRGAKHFSSARFTERQTYLRASRSFNSVSFVYEVLKRLCEFQNKFSCKEKVGGKEIFRRSEAMSPAASHFSVSVDLKLKFTAVCLCILWESASYIFLSKGSRKEYCFIQFLPCSDG